MTDGFLRGSSVLMTVPITARLVTRVASRRLARPVSLAAGGLMAVVQVGSLGFGSTPSYLWFSALEVAATLSIVGVAGR